MRPGRPIAAFTPTEAQAIAQVIYDESSAMINRLSAIAREFSDFAKMPRANSQKK